MQKSKENLQVKLALDEGLKKTWEFLQKEYPALEKSSLIRLALNNLADEKRKEVSNKQMLQVVNDLQAEYKPENSMTEEEFIEWWAKIKKELRDENNS